MSNWAFYNAVRAWVAQHSIPPAKADDVEAEVGDIYIVGEQGPEMFTPPPDAKR